MVGRGEERRGREQGKEEGRERGKKGGRERRNKQTGEAFKCLQSPIPCIPTTGGIVFTL